MPRIHLKPNSPEFDDGKKKEARQVCDMPGCRAHAEHRAPKNRGLNEYYNFCLDHVREYNKAWNFFDGMAQSEVEEHIINSLYGDRPTWRYDTNKNLEDDLNEKIWQAYTGDDSENRSNAQNAHFQANTAEFEAMSIMGLAPPVTLQDIKTRYKELAKKYHPDRNKGCKKSEEQLKSINMAYTILKLAYEHFKTLPDQD